MPPLQKRGAIIVSGLSVGDSMKQADVHFCVESSRDKRFLPTHTLLFFLREREFSFFFSFCQFQEGIPQFHFPRRNCLSSICITVHKSPPSDRCSSNSEARMRPTTAFALKDRGLVFLAGHRRCVEAGPQFIPGPSAKPKGVDLRTANE